MIHHVVPMVKRAIEGDESSQMPGWVFVVWVVNFIVLMPIILVATYTVKNVFPVLAIVEEQNPPPSYAPVALDAEAAAPQTAESDEGPNTPGGPKQGPGYTTPVTSSLRATFRHLRAEGGYRALFRGFWTLIVASVAATLVFALVSSLLPSVLAPAAVVVAALATIQLSTVWVHVVATQMSDRSFYSRLPPFRRTLVAAGPAIALFAAALELNNAMPWIVAGLAGVDFPPRASSWQYIMSSVADERADYGTKLGASPWTVPIVLSSVVTYFVLVVPAFAVAVRVQASLLPADENTIVPFDRSFGGKVEPEVVSGRGFATMRQAWTSFGRESWKRLYFVFFKLFLVDVALLCLILAVLVPQVMFLGWNKGWSKGETGE